MKKCLFPAKMVSLLILFSGLLSTRISAQEGSCAEKLRTAQILFDRGQVSQVPQLISGCLRSGFTREEALSAYKLQIQSLLFEDRFAEADSAMLAFLRNNPEYQLSPTDHSSFVFLFNTFQVKPVFQISFSIGTTMPYLSIIGDPRSLSALPHYKTYTIKPLNIVAIVEAKLPVTRRLDLNLGAVLSQVSFSNTENFLESVNVKYTEKQSRLEIPVTVTYDFLKYRSLSFYGRAGAGASMTLSAIARPEFESIIDGSYYEIPTRDIKRDDSRIFMDIFAQAGAGLKLKIPGAFVFLEARSNLGFFDQVVRGGKSADELAWDFHYIDDDYRMNSLTVSLGYTRILYKPSKRK